MSKVLIVDDSGLQRGIISRMVAGLGHETEVAHSGETALECLPEVLPDVVLTDLLMPGIGGLGLLEKMKEEGRPEPVIVITADIQRTVDERCAVLGAREVLRKPLTEEDLQQALDRVLSQPSEVSG